MQAFKSSDFAAVIHFSFAITNVTTGPSNFIWPFPTAIFKQYLVNQRNSMYYLIKILKAVLQTHTHHSEGMEYDCLCHLLYRKQCCNSLALHHLLNPGYSPFCIIEIVFLLPEK